VVNFEDYGITPRVTFVTVVVACETLRLLCNFEGDMYTFLGDACIFEGPVCQ